MRNCIMLRNEIPDRSHCILLRKLGTRNQELGTIQGPSDPPHEPPLVAAQLELVLPDPQHAWLGAFGFRLSTFGARNPEPGTDFGPGGALVVSFREFIRRSRSEGGPNAERRTPKASPKSGCCGAGRMAGALYRQPNHQSAAAHHP